MLTRTRPMRHLTPALCLAACLAVVLQSATVQAQSPRRGSVGFSTGWTDPVVEFINQQMRQSWEDNGVKPSPHADDAEWLRRVWLDVVGHVPPVEVVEKFLDDKSPTKRAEMIDQLLEDPSYVRNWTWVWTNLMIGRETPRRTSRAGMEKYLRESFARNKPWDRIVYELVTAEGHFEENGAVNYLLAQMTMRDEGVQATAKTTRLFMGMQVQCTQCHNHPFNEWKQEQFWEFNSFFRQVNRRDFRRIDPQTGRMVDDYSELVSREYTGPVYFERRTGVMQVAYPKYFDTTVDPGPGIDRRKEFARLMIDGENPLISTAFVNRMWSHFFGYGFTRPVDDMGPHNPASHPELLDRLSLEFTKSGFNPKQLIRWICNSEAYNLTSQITAENEDDNPAAGEMPLFTRMYVKAMQPEQLYDSILVATNVNRSRGADWTQAEAQRQRWLRDFVFAADNDEGEEATVFAGTIPQALTVMNGELTRRAIRTEPGTWLHEVLAERTNDAQKIRKLYLSTLGRPPARNELNAATRLLRSSSARAAGYQDLLWALLNSNEFIINH